MSNNDIFGFEKIKNFVFNFKWKDIFKKMYPQFKNYNFKKWIFKQELKILKYSKKLKIVSRIQY